MPRERTTDLEHQVMKGLCAAALAGMAAAATNGALAQQARPTIPQEISEGAHAAAASSQAIPAAQASGPSSPTLSPDVARYIEAERQRKARELQASLNKLTDAKATDTAPGAPSAPGMAPSQTARNPKALPRLWSLTGVGEAVLRAEVFHQGRVYQLDAAHPSPVGPWVVQEFTSQRIVMARPRVANGKINAKAIFIELLPPPRGRALSTYWGNAMAGGALSGEDSAEAFAEGTRYLAPSALRAANLPLK